MSAFGLLFVVAVAGAVCALHLCRDRKVTGVPAYWWQSTTKQPVCVVCVCSAAERIESHWPRLQVR